MVTGMIGGRTGKNGQGKDDLVRYKQESGAQKDQKKWPEEEWTDESGGCKQKMQMSARSDPFW